MEPNTIAAVVVALCAIGAFAKSWTNGKQLTEIHILVNSKMTAAVNEISRLNRLIAKLTGEPQAKDWES